MLLISSYNFVYFRTKSRSYFIDNVDEMTCDISQLTANDWEAILGPEASSKDTASLKTAKHDLYDIPSWIRMSPADLHFKRNKNVSLIWFIFSPPFYHHVISNESVAKRLKL